MPSYHFPGFPAFLDAAAAEIGRPEAAGPARRDATLAAVARLCAQAADAEGRHVVGILEKAEELSDRLRAAHRAAELMLADVRAGRGVEQVVATPARRTRPTPSAIEPRGATHRHG